MATLGDLIDRLFREWLTPPHEQPARAVMNDAGGISAADVTITIDPALLSTEEEGLLGEGAIVEIERELIRVNSYASPVITTDAEGRGYQGTTAATHADNLDVIITPTYSRQLAFDALSDAIVGLYPDLWRVDNLTFTSQSTPLTVPTDLKQVLHFRYELDQTWVTASVDLLDNFPHSATDVAIQTSWEVPNGCSSILTYKAGFARPTAETTVLDASVTTNPASVGIQSEWFPIVMTRALANVALARDLDAATVEFVSESLENQGFPVGSGERLQRALDRYALLLIDRAKRNLTASNPPPPTHHAQVVYRW